MLRKARLKQKLAQFFSKLLVKHVPSCLPCCYGPAFTDNMPQHYCILRHLLILCLAITAHPHTYLRWYLIILHILDFIGHSLYMAKIPFEKANETFSDRNVMSSILCFKCLKLKIHRGYLLKLWSSNMACWGGITMLLPEG